MAIILPKGDHPEKEKMNNMGSLQSQDATSQDSSKDEAFTKNHDPACPIRELQLAFGSILIARKSDRITLPPPPIPYKWTGSFALFSFPRELRDRIYYYCLYRPKGIQYRRHRRNGRFPFEDKSENLLSLFLTSRQVYEESREVLFRYNKIHITRNWCYQRRESSCRILRGFLRLIPDRPSRLIQHVVDQYEGRGTWNRDMLPSEVFVQMLFDAYVLKEHFPRLREFTALWEITEMQLRDVEGMDFEDRTEEAKKYMWYRFMTRSLMNTSIIPPTWIKFQFTDDLATHRLMSSINGAYARVLKEAAMKRAEQGELEDSGKRWLEDESRVAKDWGRKKKKQMEAGY
ncbi:hypothetical protein GQ44DRAFT_709758 [Phaeosphaeriaceae sp. PMI808]|nr:hypothetical protein GQ44DRAFT_709758 [Phaeosphaeriaceae sp. PMI808]